MKVIVLIMVFLLAYTFDAWSLHVRFTGKKDAQAVLQTTGDRKNWINGVMTHITVNKVIIDGKEYSLSRDTVMKYADGEPVSGISDFRAMESAKVAAYIDRGTATELIIEELELRD